MAYAVQTRSTVHGQLADCPLLLGELASWPTSDRLVDPISFNFLCPFNIPAQPYLPFVNE